VSTQLAQIAKKAKLDRKVRFTSLAHLLTPEFLKDTWATINRRGAGGVDGESIEQFESELEQRVREISERLKAGTYRAPPVRRVDIPKGPGKSGTRPLGIPTVADRLLQKAVARILEAVFEADFCDASYGYRPGRSPHHALRALREQIVTQKVSHIFEADIRGYFNHVCHSWLQRMVRERIADPVLLSLIGKWLKAGAMQEGVLRQPKRLPPGLRERRQRSTSEHDRMQRPGGATEQTRSEVLSHFQNLTATPVRAVRSALIVAVTHSTHSW